MKKIQDRTKALAEAFRLYEEKGPDGKKRTWGDVVDTLKERGFTSTGGTPYASGTLRAEYSKHRDAIMKAAGQSEQSDRYEQPVDERSHQYEPPQETAPQQEHKPVPSLTMEEIETRILDIAKEVFTQMMHTSTTVPTDVTAKDFPPEPVKTGRGQNRKYVRKTIVIDENLWEAFEREQKRLHVTSGRMIDAVFWRALGKPRLSYEATAEDAQAAETASEQSSQEE